MRPIVFFDIDGVLVRSQTQKLLVKFLFFKGKISFLRAVIIYLWFLLYRFSLCNDVIEIRKFAFKVFKGWDKQTMDDLIEEFYKKELSHRLNRVVIERLKNHQSQGHAIVFLSATLKEIAECLAKRMGVDFIIATELEIIDQKYTGKLKNKVPYGEDKLISVNDFISKEKLVLKDSWAYADHISDISVLKLVQRPVVVQPENALKNMAIEHGWEII